MKWLLIIPLFLLFVFSAIFAGKGFKAVNDNSKHGRPTTNKQKIEGIAGMRGSVIFGLCGLAVLFF